MFMHPIRRKRMLMILLILCSGFIAAALVLYALQQNINLYFSPAQVVQGLAPKQHVFRLGGMVEPGSIQHGKNLQVSFTVTDKAQQIKVRYNGILPDLFRAGQSVVVQGRLDADGVFIADQVLAKHGADYKPAAVSASKQVTD